MPISHKILNTTSYNFHITAAHLETIHNPTAVYGNWETQL